MAHLWIDEADARKTAPGEWSLLAPGRDALAVRSAKLLRHATPEHEVWVLIGPPAIRVNGIPLDAGVRVLRDRDELRADGSRIFFSTESLATIVPFPGGDRPTFCPRCKLEIVPHTPAVRCPQCNVWHHQSDDMPCWLYAACCTLCDQPTALEAGFRWTPEDL